MVMKSKSLYVRIVATVIFVAALFWIHKPHPLSTVLAKKIRTSQFQVWVPVPVEDEINQYYNGDIERLFSEVISLSKRAFIKESTECTCTAVYAEFHVNFLGYRLLAQDRARFVFYIENGKLSLGRASLTREML